MSGKWSSVGIAVACALVILANAPAVLIDPISLALAQIRVNAATTVQASETGAMEMVPETPAKRKTLN